MNETETFLNPIIKAMQLEGSYHLHPPCHLSEEGEECTIGSKWSEVAQAGLAHVDSAELDAHDEFHQTWYINFFPKEGEPHFYHPHIDPNSSSHTQPLNVTTVTEAVYEKLDTFDNPLVSNMAKELRIKFNSRQAILKGLGIDRPFPESEIPNICSKLNAQTIKWALAKAPERVRNRYLDHGVKLVAGRDIEHNNGPAWIWSYLEYNLEEQSEGNMQRVLDSHTMKTALDHPIPASDGKHYCKLLSPAKAMDWIYTDALREQKSDKKGC